MVATSGRIAVVTGANKGIGYFIALHLGLSGLFEHVILACRDANRGSQALESLRPQLPASVQISAESLTIGDQASHRKFADRMDQLFGKVDVLVNNAGFAFKNTDPTPFQQQCQPTLAINLYGTLDFINVMLPLLKKGTDPRIVNVASMTGRLGQLSPERQAQLSSDQLTTEQVVALAREFENDIINGNWKQKGWGNSNYGMSKLFLIAATKTLAREHPNVSINACCPGYCDTDMTSHKGVRHPSDGARNAVIPATMDNPVTGQFFSDYQVAQW